MALVLGESSGFVKVAPTGDPTGGASVVIDGASVVTKHTAPGGATKISEIGWYRNSGTNTANFEIALYDSDGTVVPGEAGTRLYVDATNSSSATGWIVTAVDWDITPGHVYWLGLQMDAHSGSSYIDAETANGVGYDRLTSQTTLNTPYGGGALSQASGMAAIYALVNVKDVSVGEDPKASESVTVSDPYPPADRDINLNIDYGYASENITIFTPEYLLNVFDLGNTTEYFDILYDHDINVDDIGYTTEYVEWTTDGGVEPDRDINIDVDYAYATESVPLNVSILIPNFVRDSIEDETYSHIFDAEPYMVGNKTGTVENPEGWTLATLEQYSSYQIWEYRNNIKFSGDWSLYVQDDGGNNDANYGAWKFTYNGLSPNYTKWYREYIYIPSGQSNIKNSGYAAFFTCNTGISWGIESDGSGNIYRWFACATSWYSRSYGDHVSAGNDVPLDQWILVEWSIKNQTGQPQQISLYINGATTPTCSDTNGASGNQNSSISYLMCAAGVAWLTTDTVGFGIYRDNFKCRDANDGGRIGPYNPNAVYESISASDFGENLIPYAGSHFDTDGTTVWTPLYDTTLTWQDSSFMRINSTIGTCAGFYEWFLEAGKNYKITFRAKSSNYTGEMNQGVTSAPCEGGNVTTDWKTFTCYRYNNNYNAVRIQTTYDAGNNIIVDIDDIIVEEILWDVEVPDLGDLNISSDYAYVSTDFTNQVPDLGDLNTYENIYVRTNLENIIPNSFEWVDSDSDGLADNWFKMYGGENCSIVTGNGFTGNAQRMVNAGGSQAISPFEVSYYPLKVGKTYRISFKYRSSGDFRLLEGVVFTIKQFDQNTGNAISYSVDYSVRSVTNQWLTFFAWSINDWFEIDEVEVIELDDVQVLVDNSLYDDIFVSEDFTVSIEIEGEINVNIVSDYGYASESVTLETELAGIDLYESVNVSEFGENLIPSASSNFDTDGTSWWGGGKCTLSWNSGTHDMTGTITDANANQGLVEFGILTYGEIYFVKFRAKSDTMTMTPGIYNGSEYENMTGGNLESTYKEFTWSGSIRGTDFYIRLGYDESVGETFIIDDIILEKVLLDIDVLVDNFLYESVNVSDSELGGEIVLNGAFDSNVDNWTAWSNATISWDSGKLKTTNTESSRALAYQAVSVQAGKTYRFSVQGFIGTPGNGPQFHIGTAVVFDDILTQYTIPDGEYYTGYVIATEDDTWYLVHCHQSGSINDYSYLDNVSFKEIGTELEVLVDNFLYDSVNVSEDKTVIVEVTGELNIFDFFELISASESLTFSTELSDISINDLGYISESITLDNTQLGDVSIVELGYIKDFNRIDGTRGTNADFDSGPGLYDYCGQSFLGDGNVIDYAIFELRKVGTPTDQQIRIEIFDHTGTYGVNGVPSNYTPLATSESMLASDLPVTRDRIQFNFKGTNRITLTAGTPYCIVIVCTGTNTSNCYNALQYFPDYLDVIHSGIQVYRQTSGTWQYYADDDTCFELYSTPTVEVLVDNSLYESINVTEFITLDNTQLGNISIIELVDVIDYGLGSELIQNGHFESNVSYWNTLGGTITQSSEQAHSGNYSLKFVGTSVWGVWTDPPFANTVGKTYKYDFWVYRTTGCEWRICLWDGVTDNFVGTSTSFGAPENEWFNVIVYWTAVTTQMWLEINQLTSEIPYYIDDVSVKEMTEDLPILEVLVDNSLYELVNVSEDYTVSVEVVGEINLNVSLDYGYASESITLDDSQLGDINVNDLGYVSESVTLLNEFYIIDTFELLNVSESITLFNTQLGDINIITDFGYTTESITLDNTQLGDINVNDPGRTTESITTDLLLELSVFDNSFSTENITLDNSQLGDIFIITDIAYVSENVNVWSGGDLNVNMTLDIANVSEDIQFLFEQWNVDVFDLGYVSEYISNINEFYLINIFDSINITEDEIIKYYRDLICDFHPSSYYNTYTNLGQNMGITTGVGQTFTGDGYKFRSFQLYVQRTGSPDLTLTPYLYNISGTFGSTSIPSGAPLLTGNQIHSSAIDNASLYWFNFTFPEEYQLTLGTHYCIAIIATGTGDSSNYIRFGIDTPTSYHPGNIVLRNSGTWVSDTSDLLFYVLSAVEASSGIDSFDFSYSTESITVFLPEFVIEVQDFSNVIESIQLLQESYINSYDFIYSTEFIQFDIILEINTSEIPQASEFINASFDPSTIDVADSPKASEAILTDFDSFINTIDIGYVYEYIELALLYYEVNITSDIAYVSESVDWIVPEAGAINITIFSEEARTLENISFDVSIPDLFIIENARGIEDIQKDVEVSFSIFDIGYTTEQVSFSLLVDLSMYDIGYVSEWVNILPEEAGAVNISNIFENARTTEFIFVESDISGIYQTEQVNVSEDIQFLIPWYTLEIYDLVFVSESVDWIVPEASAINITIFIEEARTLEDVNISNIEMPLDIYDYGYVSEIILTTWTSLLIDVSSFANITEDYQLYNELGDIFLYDDIYSSEWFEVEAPYIIIVEDQIYTSEDVTELLISYVSILETIAYSENIKVLLPGGKEVFESIYINNIVTKSIEIPSEEIIISLNVNSIPKQMIEIKDANS